MAETKPEPVKKFINYHDTVDGKIWKSIGIPVCKLCGSKRICSDVAVDQNHKVTATLMCPNGLDDCLFIKPKVESEY